MKLYLSNDIYAAGVYCLVDGTKLSKCLRQLRAFSFNPFLLMKWVGLLPGERKEIREEKLEGHT